MAGLSDRAASCVLAGRARSSCIQLVRCAEERKLLPLGDALEEENEHVHRSLTACPAYHTDERVDLVDDKMKDCW